MSKVAIQGAATGTGVFTLASPATNTDRTLVLPDEAGTVLTNTSGVVKTGDTMTGALIVQNAGFDSRITLQNTGTGGQTFNIFSTMNSFTQGGGNLMFHSSSAPNGILKMGVSGRVTMPYQPAFLARKTAGQVVPAGNTDVVPFQTTVAANTNSGWDGNSRFTAPVAGWYYVSAQINFLTNGQNSVSATVYKNGSTAYIQDAITSPSMRQNVTPTGAVYCNASDYLEITFFSNGQATTLDNAGSLSIYLIG